MKRRRQIRSMSPAVVSGSPNGLPLRHGRFIMAAALALSAGFLVLSCSNNDRSQQTSIPRPGESLPSSRATGAEITAKPGNEREHMRNCSSALYSRPHDASAWDSDDVAGGLIAFLGIAEMAPTITADQLQPDQAHKFVTVVNGSAIGAVTLSIAEEYRAQAVLTYDPAEWSGTTMAAGDFTVRFETCPGEDKQYNGGFRLNRPGCIELLVRDEGTDRGPVRARIPFGVPACPTSSR